MWIHFEIFALTSLASWFASCMLFIPRTGKSHIFAEILVLVGIGSLLYFTISLWIHLDRPPLRTLGETRLWYSLFLSIIGYVIYKRWHYRILLIYALAMAFLFLYINYIKPDVQSKELMPALQSIWFIPHVIVYIIGYAFLGFASLIAVLGIIHKKHNNTERLHMSENLVYIGYGFITLGLIFGALWAKEAWGHYWTWDPKETWALITWGTYLTWIHLSIKKTYTHRFYFWLLSIAFVILLVSWFGVNYLPSTQSSIHVYS